MVLDFIEILKVIFLGIVEGITEWLPISSTGHMILVDEFITLNMSEAFKEMFFVVIQLGAILAVVVMFWNKMFPFQFKNKAQSIVKKDTFSLWFKGYRQESCALFRQPHKPAVRCGYPSSRVTSR